MYCMQGYLSCNSTYLQLYVSCKATYEAGAQPYQQYCRATCKQPHSLISSIATLLKTLETLKCRVLSNTFLYVEYKDTKSAITYFLIYHHVLAQYINISLHIVEGEQRKRLCPLPSAGKAKLSAQASRSEGSSLPGSPRLSQAFPPFQALA